MLFITLNTSFQPLLACKVSFGIPTECLMEIPLQITLCFYFAAFQILSLSLTFDTLVIISLGGSSLFSSCLGLCVLPGLVCLILHEVREVFCHFFSNRFPISCTPLLLL